MDYESESDINSYRYNTKSINNINQTSQISGFKMTELSLEKWLRTREGGILPSEPKSSARKNWDWTYTVPEIKNIGYDSEEKSCE